MAADAVGKARSRIAGLEDGTATASTEDLVALLDCYSVRGLDRRTVLNLGEQARKRQKRRVYVDTLPDAYDRFADLEATASKISTYESGIIPGSLQSPEYARAVIAEGDGIWWEVFAVDGEDRLNFRLRRQEQLWNSTGPKELRYVLTEDALHANMGAPEIMRGQWLHLLVLLEKRKDLDIRVLPNGVYGNPVRGGGVVIFEFGDGMGPVGYSPIVSGPSTYYDDSADVAGLRRAFDRIWELSLSPRESKRLIAELVKET
jgi:hypothetical protein